MTDFRDGWSNGNPTQKGTADMSQEFQMVQLDRLYESATNPRRKFHGLEELTASVKQHGVLTPLLVRPVAGSDGNLEIIAGARRHRAAIAAKIEEIPVRVKQMSDQEALELQIIENLQRRDVHPLDEGLGYKRLEDMGQTVEQIASKVDKSESYIYQRMKLAALTEPWQELFLNDEITPGHAVQIARLNPQHQKELLKDMKQRDMSVRELGQHIANNYHLRLTEAPFPTDDATLLAEAGACKVCPKRSGANPLLFPDVKAKDTCADPICFHKKVAAFVSIQTEAHPEAVKLSVGHHYDRQPKFENAFTVARGKKCEAMTEAVVAEVLDPYAAKRENVKLGQVVSICTDKNCKEHHRQIPERQDGGYKKSASDKKAEKVRKLELKRRGAIIQAVLLREGKELRTDEQQYLLEHICRNMSHEAAKTVADAMGWVTKKDRSGGVFYQDLVLRKVREMKDPLNSAFLMAVATQESWYSINNGRTPSCEHLEAAAERRGVNVDAISKQVKEAAEKKPTDARKAANGKAGAEVRKATKKPAKAKKAKKKAA